MKNTNGNGKQIDLRPVAIALNHLPLYEDCSVVVNPAQISHWTFHSSGNLYVYMVGGSHFSLSPPQAEAFIARMNAAIEMTRRQMDQRIVSPDVRAN